MNALAYIRVSSWAQDHTTQRAAIERFAAGQGDTIEDWRAEKRSAKTMAREELQRLLADARAGRLRGRRLYLFRLDRLTRSGIADTLTTLDELRANGVAVVSIADGFDLNGPHAEVIIAVMAWAAKMERLATAEPIAGARADRGRRRAVGAPFARRPGYSRARGGDEECRQDGTRDCTRFEGAAFDDRPRSTSPRARIRASPRNTLTKPECSLFVRASRA